MKHTYRVSVTWTGNRGSGTANYRAYDRSHEISAPGSAKPSIPGSSDPAFRGDRARWNPEELFVATLSACHKLFYLHFCADAGIVVTKYEDAAEGVMEEFEDGRGHFSSVILKPHVTLAKHEDIARATALHHKAHEFCFIANSTNFPVTTEPTFAAPS